MSDWKRSDSLLIIGEATCSVLPNASYDLGRFYQEAQQRSKVPINP